MAALGSSLGHCATSWLAHAVHAAETAPDPPSLAPASGGGATLPESGDATAPPSGVDVPAPTQAWNSDPLPAPSSTGWHVSPAGHAWAGSVLSQYGLQKPPDVWICRHARPAPQVALPTVSWQASPAWPGPLFK